MDGVAQTRSEIRQVARLVVARGRLHARRFRVSQSVTSILGRIGRRRRTRTLRVDVLRRGYLLLQRRDPRAPLRLERIELTLDLGARRRQVPEGRADALGVLLDDLVEAVDGLLGLFMIVEVALADGTCVDIKVLRRVHLHDTCSTAYRSTDRREMTG